MTAPKPRAWMHRDDLDDLFGMPGGYGFAAGLIRKYLVGGHAGRVDREVAQ